MTDKQKPFIHVYCPELQDMIRPGEWTACPYFEGKALDLSNSEDVLKQIFRCHVQCGCKIEYQYYEDGRLVSKAEDSIEDEDTLRNILAKVVKKRGGDEPLIEAKKVLLVDDDKDFLEMHTAVLEHRGYQVLTAQSATECLLRLEEIRPDIVVLDVMMEQFDAGFKTAGKIKAKYGDLPVMLLTSIGTQTDLDFSSNKDVLSITGADILLDKPVSPKVLIDEIERLTS